MHNLKSCPFCGSKEKFSPAQASAAAADDEGERGDVANFRAHMEWLMSETKPCDMRGAILGVLSCYPQTLAERDRLREENRGLSDKCEAASDFIRGCIEAVGYKEQPPEGFVVDTEKMLAVVVGTIEQYKHEANEAEATISSLTANLDAAILGVRHAQAERDSLTARVAELEPLVRRYASECGECGGTGAARVIPDHIGGGGCAYCADIRTALQASDKREKGEKPSPSQFAPPPRMKE